MDDGHDKGLTEDELTEFFGRLLPHGFASADVIQEIAPEGWENSPLLACFHPSPAKVLEERLQLHRSSEWLRRTLKRTNPENPSVAPDPEPTMEQVLADWQEEPINILEEVTEIVGRCLWDVFSDNQKVIAADGRLVDIGSFRGASIFLGDYVASPNAPWRRGDEYRFYMGSVLICWRADLTPVYRMIFRRLKLLGADWQYHFPQVYLVELSPRQATEQPNSTYSPSEAFGKEQERERQAELQRARNELEKVQKEARRKAMDKAPPDIVRAYQAIYGRDPNGWPP